MSRQLTASAMADHQRYVMAYADHGSIPGKGTRFESRWATTLFMEGITGLRGSGLKFSFSKSRNRDQGPTTVRRKCSSCEGLLKFDVHPGRNQPAVVTDSIDCTCDPILPSYGRIEWLSRHATIGFENHFQAKMEIKRQMIYHERIAPISMAGQAPREWIANNHVDEGSWIRRGDYHVVILRIGPSHVVGCRIKRRRRGGSSWWSVTTYPSNMHEASSMVEVYDIRFAYALAPATQPANIPVAASMPDTNDVRIPADHPATSTTYPSNVWEFFRPGLLAAAKEANSGEDTLAGSGASWKCTFQCALFFSLAPSICTHL